jgi:hypothetical protein
MEVSFDTYLIVVFMGKPDFTLFCCRLDLDNEITAFYNALRSINKLQLNLSTEAFDPTTGINYQLFSLTTSFCVRFE